MKKRSVKARFKHDCESCQWLGTFNDHDLYYCNNQLPTVIARYEDNGPGYTSGLMVAREYPLSTFTGRTNKGSVSKQALMESNIALRVAYLIALDLGLVKKS